MSASYIVTASGIELDLRYPDTKHILLADIAHHLAHGAMAGGDPLVDSLYGQLEGPAQEGAHAPLPYSAGRAQERSARQRLAAAGRDPGLYWLMAAACVLVVLISIAYPLGAAA